MASEERSDFTIVQFSDIHCGDSRFDEDLILRVIRDANALGPDLVLVPGDLTASGYRDEFEEAKHFLDMLSCPHVLVLSGNHDNRKVGYVHFDEIFGERNGAHLFDFGMCCDQLVQEKIRVVTVDSSKPDLDDGEVGRFHYDWLEDQLEGDDFKVVALHHHLVSIPGTGRERNIVYDAGDVLDILYRQRADLVVAGHKHVPYVWPVGDMLVVTSGTASTWRTRGYTPPSYNVIRITPTDITVEICNSANHDKDTRVFPRTPK